MTRVCLAVISIFFISLAAHADQSIIATGQAGLRENITESRRLAVEDALRTAVERSIGLYIDSVSATMNYELIKDSIYTHSSAYITAYEILSEEPSFPDQVYTVVLSASVQTESILNDLRAVGIMLKRAGRPRFLIQPAAGFSETKYFEIIEQTLANTLLDKGFIIVQNRFGANPFDYLIRCHLTANYSTRPDALFDDFHLNLTLIVSKPDMHRLISDLSNSLLVKIPKNTGTAEKVSNLSAVKSGLIQITRQTADDLVNKLMAHLASDLQNGTVFVIHLSGMPLTEFHGIIQMIAAIPGISSPVLRRAAGSEIELEVLFKGSLLDLDQQIARELKNKGTDGLKHNASGNRIYLGKDK